MVALTYHVHTDGGCKPNPGSGAWAFIIHDNYGEVHRDSGTADYTTNNRMEIAAAIEALKWIPDRSIVKIYTDSQIVVNTMKPKDPWKRNKNNDLWDLLDEQRSRMNTVKFEWVKGHADNRANNMADYMASQAIKENRHRTYNPKSLYCIHAGA